MNKPIMEHKHQCIYKVWNINYIEPQLLFEYYYTKYNFNIFTDIRWSLFKVKYYY